MITRVKDVVLQRRSIRRDHGPACPGKTSPCGQSPTTDKSVLLPHLLATPVTRLLGSKPLAEPCSEQTSRCGKSNKQAAAAEDTRQGVNEPAGANTIGKFSKPCTPLVPLPSLSPVVLQRLLAALALLMVAVHLVARSTASDPGGSDPETAEITFLLGRASAFMNMQGEPEVTQPLLAQALADLGSALHLPPGCQVQPAGVEILASYATRHRSWATLQSYFADACSREDGPARDS